jgi:hypothetical protein
MKNLHYIVKTLILVVGLSTSLYLFMNNQEESSSKLTVATLIIMWLL